MARVLLNAAPGFLNSQTSTAFGRIFLVLIFLTRLYTLLPVRRITKSYILVIFVPYSLALWSLSPQALGPSKRKSINLQYSITKTCGEHLLWLRPQPPCWPFLFQSFSRHLWLGVVVTTLLNVASRNIRQGLLRRRPSSCRRDSRLPTYKHRTQYRVRKDT